MKKRHILAGLGFCFVLLLTWSLVWPPSAQAATIKVDVRVEGPEHTLVNVTDYAVNAELDYGFTTAAAAFRQVLSDANIQYQAYPTYCYFTEIDGYRETRINDVYLGWSYGLKMCIRDRRLTMPPLTPVFSKLFSAALSLIHI